MRPTRFGGQRSEVEGHITCSILDATSAAIREGTAQDDAITMNRKSVWILDGR
jgi:hypothetical protein